MAGRDRIEIEQDGRTLRGIGTLRVAPGAPGQGGWPVVHVEGTVTFDDRVAADLLWAMDEAEMEVDLANGTRHAFGLSVS